MGLPEVAFIPRQLAHWLNGAGVLLDLTQIPAHGDGECPATGSHVTSRDLTAGELRYAGHTMGNQNGAEHELHVPSRTCTQHNTHISAQE